MDITARNNKQVANWLLLGVIMIVIQVLIGGLTRLTESGLSITEWKPITGALPPMNSEAWRIEFEKYMQTDQFKYVHSDFTLSDFKFIFFWEWFHRQWARLLGLVFLAGFIYFVAKRKLRKEMIWPLVILFILGGLQGAIGWIMVQSGLVPEKFYVGHVELATHFIAALILLAYTIWFTLTLLPSYKQKTYNSSIKNILFVLLALIFIQLIYGAFMAGLKAAISAPTWPDINGEMMPAAINELSPWKLNLVNNNLMVHFIHRGIAYVIFIVTCIFFVKALKVRNHPKFSNLSSSFMGLVLLQVLLGIMTVLYSTDRIALIWLGVSHQFVAMVIVMVLVALLYIVRRKEYQR